MKKTFIFILLAITLAGCKSSKIGSTRNLELRFLDEYVLAENLQVEGTIVGGLSEIDYHDGRYFLVTDDPRNPRFYEVDIQLKDERIDTIIFNKTIPVEALSEEHLDLEGILYDARQDNFILASEGSVKEEKDPLVFSVTPEGEFADSYQNPENFRAASEKKPRHNGTFEGLAWSHDHQGIWVAMELPLVTDGPKAKLIRTKSPVRITYFNKETKQAEKQFPYMLEPVAKIPWMYFAVNGVTALLEYAPNKFLVVERGFASGHGSKGNTVRIFDVDNTLATNTLDRNNLRVTFYNPAKKELVYDFKWAKKFLGEAFIDNIEGISFGPTLPNGKKTLILVSDNNFNSLGRQLTQFILMEIDLKE